MPTVVYRNDGIVITPASQRPLIVYPQARTGPQGPTGPQGTIGPTGVTGVTGDTGADGAGIATRLYPSGGSLATQLASPSSGDKYFLESGVWFVGNLELSQSDVSIYADNAADIRMDADDRILISGDRNLLHGLVIDNEGPASAFDHMVEVSGDYNEIAYCAFTCSGTVRTDGIKVTSTIGTAIHDCVIDKICAADSNLVYIDNGAGSRDIPTRVEHCRLVVPAGTGGATVTVGVRVNTGLHTHVMSNWFDLTTGQTCAGVAPTDSNKIDSNRFEGDGVSAQYAILIEGSVTDVDITSNLAEDIYSVVHTPTGGLLSNSVISSNMLNQSAMFGQLARQFFSFCTFDSNVVYNGRYGIVLTTAVGNVVSNNSLHGGTSATYGVYVAGSVSRENTICGNTVLGNFSRGIYVVGTSSKIAIIGNSTKDCLRGIELIPAAGTRADFDTTVVGNVLCGPGSGAVTGLHVDDDVEGFIIAGNVVRENWPANNGILVDAGCDHFVIAHNVCNDLDSPAADATKIVQDNILY